ncbi:RM24 protein, partial [Eubucco bourcierii]|nr:RM24 protein [Eubucco bourcierii]
MRLSVLLSAARRRLPSGYRHGTWHPDTAAAQLRNPPGQRRRKIFVEPIPKDEWKVFCGDTVSPIPGGDGDPLPTSQTPGVSQHYRYISRTAKYPGTYIASEAPLLLSQITLIDPEDRGRGRGRKGGARTASPPPRRPQLLAPSADGPKDTSVEEVQTKTFQASLKTFEEEVMEAMGIVESRRAKKSYWY